jgi:ketosteroid isomerase-like protein
MSQENVEIVRQGWDAWLRGDLPRLFGYFDAEVVWDTSNFRDWPRPRITGERALSGS